MRPEQSKVLFLDMDGVLCTTRSHYAYSRMALYRHLDPIGCRLVQRLCSETKAKLVLSSAWRAVYDFSAMYTILCNGGFSELEFHSSWRTPDFNGLHSRGQEIKHWLNENGNPRYCILDDQTDMLPEQQPYFVLTDTRDGFLMSHYDKALAILK